MDASLKKLPDILYLQKNGLQEAKHHPNIVLCFFKKDVLHPSIQQSSLRCSVNTENVYKKEAYLEPPN